MLDLFKAAPHVRLHHGQTMVIKAGGGSVAKKGMLRNIARQLFVVQALGARVVLVHGGGPQTDALQRALGEEPQMVDGRRVTSPKAMRALRMATAGELNGDVIAALASEGAPAVGVSAASAGLLVAKKRPPIETSVGIVDFGAVGDVTSVDVAPLEALLDAGRLPVVCPPAGDGKGGLLNVNADLAAAAIAAALGASKLVLLTGAPGILSDPDESDSLLSVLALADLDELQMRGTLRDGMSVKVAAIRAALAGGVERAHVVSGSDPDALLVELYTNHGAGTLITKEPQAAPGAVASAGVTT